MKMHVSREALLPTNTDAWLFFAEKEKVHVSEVGEPLTKRLTQMVKHWREQTEFKGKPAEVTVFPAWETLPVRYVVLAGLGDSKTCRADALFRAGGAAARDLKRLSARSVAFSYSHLEALSPRFAEANLEALLCGMFAGQYKFTRFRSEVEHRQELDIRVFDAASRFSQIRKRVREIALLTDTMREILDLANLPGNEAPPHLIAECARRLAPKYGVSCEVWNRRKLEQKKCGGLLAVGRGSMHEPRLIILRYPGTDRSSRPLALVGKTITFDTGGISLKPGKGMEWMKYDKSGGMAVLAATIAAARLRFRKPVLGLLAVAENMPGGRATRPGDIIRTYSGKTVEVLNTDAEGRLVLADALAIAVEHKPSAIVDLATLTGACIVALGHVLAGLMSNNERLSKSLQQAGELTGERVWPLPLLPEYEEDIKGQFAEIKNVGDNGAGTIIGGTFLKQFVPEAIPWAHLDIAGTAYAEKAQPHRDAGATLFGTRLLLHWMRSTIQV